MVFLRRSFMLTEADIVRIMAENYGTEKHATGNSLTTEPIDHEIYDAYDNGDPHDQSCYDISVTT